MYQLQLNVQGNTPSHSATLSACHLMVLIKLRSLVRKTGRAEVGLNAIHLNSVQAIRHRRKYYAQQLRSTQFLKINISLLAQGISRCYTQTVQATARAVKILSPSPSPPPLSPSFRPSWPTVCVHAVGWICPSTSNIMQVSEPAWYKYGTCSTCKWAAQDGISLVLPAANRVPRLFSQLLFCARSPCPVRGICNLYRPKQALDATHRHCYSCVCCLFRQHADASIVLCYSICKPVQV